MLLIIAACLFLTFLAYSFNVSYVWPSQQAEKMRIITDDAALPFPSSARVTKFYKITEDVWMAKVMIPESSYAAFKEAVSKKPISPFQNTTFWNRTSLLSFLIIPYWWESPDPELVDPEFKKAVVGSHFVFSVELHAMKNDDGIAVYVGCECH
jgi:hypothetical protein